MTETASAAPGDKITGPFSDDLAGRTVEYRYSTGNHYRMAFGSGQLTFLHLNAPEPHDPVPLAYVARQLRPGQYLVHWAVKPANIHVGSGLRPRRGDCPRVGAHAGRMGVLRLRTDRE